MNKSAGYAELLSSKLRSDKILVHRDALRSAKLRSFLDQHRQASQWSACITALVDASRHNVNITSDMICDAIDRCGKRGMLTTAKKLYTDFHRDINKPRSKPVHIAYMTACAECGDFKEAHSQYLRLKERDAALFKKNAAHVPVVNDDLTSEYLRAALVASTKRLKKGVTANGAEGGGCDGCSDAGSRSTVDVDANNSNRKLRVAEVLPWELALKQFVSLRTGGEGFRGHNLLTPVIVQRVSELLEVAGDWQRCLYFLHSCGQQNILIPPEARDAAISLCYRYGRHGEVVHQMQEMIATRSPPDERSVKLALTSCEEVVAMERLSLLRPCHGQGAWALGVVLFNAMRSNGIEMHQQNYESPLRSCAMAGRWEDALSVLKIMKKDGRPVSVHVYRLVFASRIEQCSSFDEAQRYAGIPAMQNGGMVVYLALLRCCMNLGDWKNFERVNKEMRDREFPETFDKMRLLIEAAYMRCQWHSVLMRFARFESIAGHELKRVVEDKIVRRYDEDFHMPHAILDMVMDAYEHVKDHKDPAVHMAYSAAVRRKGEGTSQLSFTTLSPLVTPQKEWMFSRPEPA